MSWIAATPVGPGHRLGCGHPFDCGDPWVAATPWGVVSSWTAATSWSAATSCTVASPRTAAKPRAAATPYGPRPWAAFVVATHGRALHWKRANGGSPSHAVERAQKTPTLSELIPGNCVAEGRAPVAPVGEPPGPTIAHGARGRDQVRPKVDQLQRNSASSGSMRGPRYPHTKLCARARLTFPRKIVCAGFRCQLEPACVRGEVDGRMRSTLLKLGSNSAETSRSRTRHGLNSAMGA